jgi:hypothetical protein
MLVFRRMCAMHTAKREREQASKILGAILDVDPRTAAKFLDGKPVRGPAGRKLAAADDTLARLQEAGILPASEGEL